MIIVDNQTKRVVTIYNTNYSVDIPIGETVEIDTEQLGNDGNLFCRYFSANGEEISVDYGIKRGGIRRRMHGYYENESAFSLVTLFQVKDGQSFCLKEESVSLRQILLFKVVRLKKISVMSSSGNVKSENLFYDALSKRRFLSLMRMSAFLLPVAAILLLIGAVGLFNNEFDLMEKLMITGFLGVCSLLIFEDAYYYFIGKRLKILDESIE